MTALVITIYRKYEGDSWRGVGCVYRLLQGVAAAQLFQLRVRAGSLAPVSVSALARKVLLHAAIWYKHTPADTPRQTQGG